MIEYPCPVCGCLEAKIEPYGATSKVECPQCGNYGISSSLSNSDDLKILKSKLYIVSAHIREHNDRSDQLFTLDSYNVNEIAAHREKSTKEKIDSLLLAFQREDQQSENGVHLSNKAYIARSSARNVREYKVFLNYLFSKNFTDGDYKNKKEYDLNTRAHVTAEGLMYIESLNRNPDSKQGFVAMWFGKHEDESKNEVTLMDTIYEQGIKAAIEKDTINDVPIFNAFRVDKEEHNDKIDDKIVAEIQRSRFVVADFTGHRGGVYFEAGYALGRGIPVIWTCREQDFKDRHFDIYMYNCIVWKTPEDLKEKLYQRIRMTVGEKIEPVP